MGSWRSLTVIAGAAIIVVGLLAADRYRTWREAQDVAFAAPSAQPHGPLRRTIVARGLTPPYPVLLVDASNVYFTRSEPNNETSLRALSKARGIEREVAKAKSATLVAQDASSLYLVDVASEALTRASKTDGVFAKMPGKCAPPMLAEGTTIFCRDRDGAFGRWLQRLDAASGSVRWRVEIGKIADGNVATIERAGSKLFVGTAFVGGREGTSHVLEVDPEDGAGNIVASGLSYPLIATDSLAVYAVVDGPGGGDAVPIVRRPLAAFDRATTLARHHPSGLALTEHYVLWCVRDEDVFAVPKAGGAVESIGGGQGCSGLAADAATVFFIDKWGAIIRVDGLDD
ncbi:MAG: hypothetical protein ACHREM_01335 [Polyangiales bacterium]